MAPLHSSSSNRNRSKLLIVSAAILILSVFLLSTCKQKTPPWTHRRLHTTSRLIHSIAASHCDNTLYPDLCISTLLSMPDLPNKSLPTVITAVVNHTADAVISSSRNCSSILRYSHRHLDPRQRLALSDCIELLDATLDDLRLASHDLRSSLRRRRSYRADLATVLSAAITNQFTCLDGFAFTPNAESIRPKIQHRLVHISRLVSNALAMSKKIPPLAENSGVFEEDLKGDGFPTWLGKMDQQILQAPAPAPAPGPNPEGVLMPDLVVAKDGSGNFTTVGEAVAAAPNNSATRFVIYIKEGGYFENVEVGKNKINMMWIGDGMGKTVIKSSRNVVDGWTTFRSATVAVVGKGFIARDLTIENSAGPSKHQAVALRCGADLSAFYRCSFVGYQDTLYAHSLRQFYRECDVYGTVDFVFGDAAAVFQNCSLYARKPDPDQKNIFTAQGREDPYQNTGISLLNCKMASAADLLPVEADFRSYLGRPWKKYSRTVVIHSYLGSLIDQAGWMEWNETFALDTLYYGEYMNRGPGANTSGRVTWAGFRVINGSAEAANFTVANFIQGDQWLGSYGLPFASALD